MSAVQFDHVSAHYGDPSFPALRDVSFGLETGSVLAVLGTNGAGKSTVLKVIARHACLESGEVRLNGQTLGGIAAHEVCRYGVAYVPEGQRVWPNLTVTENLRLGAYHRADQRETGTDLLWVLEVFPKLAALASRKAYGLSGGERQMVAVGRALMARPRLLLLDEPSLGLAPAAVAELFDLLTKVVKDRALTVILVEQNGGAALAASNRVLVLHLGQVVLDEDVQRVTWARDIEPLLMAVPPGRAR